MIFSWFLSVLRVIDSILSKRVYQSIFLYRAKHALTKIIGKLREKDRTPSPIFSKWVFSQNENILILRKMGKMFCLFIMIFSWSLSVCEYFTGVDQHYLTEFSIVFWLEGFLQNQMQVNTQTAVTSYRQLTNNVHTFWFTGKNHGKISPSVV